MFVRFCRCEAAANPLTNPVLDTFGKIPEFEYCAVRVTAGGTSGGVIGNGTRWDPMTADEGSGIVR